MAVVVVMVVVAIVVSCIHLSNEVFSFNLPFRKKYIQAQEEEGMFAWKIPVKLVAMSIPGMCILSF